MAVASARPACCGGKWEFKGEIRATGNPKADQGAYLIRCGVDAFEVRGSQPLETWQKAVASVTRVYQRTYQAGAGETKG